MLEAWPFLLLYLLLVMLTTAGLALYVGVRRGIGLAVRIASTLRRVVAGQPRQRVPERRPVPLIGVRATPQPAPADEDLFVYPRRLAELEVQLSDRCKAVQQQSAVLRARQGDLEQKGTRDELTKKYAQDRALLDRRADGMRRVLGLVWKTRAVLLARAHLAQTARRRPNLGRLPDTEVATGRPEALRSGTATYHSAAAAVRSYLDLVDAHASTLPGVLPTVPEGAEIDDAAREAVRAELDEVQAAYLHLREDMDRLADNLTWLGDHFATLAVVESSPTAVAPDAGPGALIQEVEDALGQLAELARAVDPAVADAAVDSLAEDISQLEAAGLEVQAEADAELEIARLLRAAGA